MSKHFFAGYSLIILFVSMNLLSMDCNKSSIDLKSREKEGQEYKDRWFTSPSLIGDFKHQSIVLHRKSANLYSLVFNRNQEPFITQYLLDGKQVAKAIQIGDEIHFESDNSKQYNFSLQIPYQVGSLTINTSGKCIFDKKIDTYSTFLTSKKVDFCSDFFSANGLIVQADNCKSHSRFECSDFLFNGKKFKIISKSSLNIHHSLTLLADVVLNEGIIKCKNESLIKSLFFKNVGDFSAQSVRFKGNSIVNQGMLTIGDTFYCASKLFEHSGILDVSNNCILEKGDVFSSTSSSVWNVNGEWKSFIAFLYLQGSFNVNNLYIVGKNFISTSPFHCIVENATVKLEEDMTNGGVIKVLGLLDVDSKNIKLTKTSSLIAENADLKVDQAIQNEGIVSLKNHLSIHARSISNAGKIEARSSSIKADRYFYNKILSILSAKDNLTINTPLSLNLLGLTNAQFLTINSAIGVNALGIYLAKNINANALVSLNAGLLLPKFSTFTQMCSWQNLYGLGESLFIKYVPMYGTMYATLKNIKGLYHQGRTLCSEIGSVYKQKNVGASDVIALICLTKCILTSLHETSHLGKQSHRLLSDYGQADKVQNSEVPEIPSDTVSTAKNIAQQTISTAISTAMSQESSVNTSSLFDLKYGFAAGINNHSTSLYAHNSNSVYVHNAINTCWGINTGYLGAYNLNVNATNSYFSHGHIRIGSNGFIKANDISLRGPVNALKNVKLEGSYTNIADVTAEKLEVKSQTCNASGKVEVSDGSMRSSYLNVSGSIDALRNIQLEGTRSADISGDVKAQNIEIKSDGKITNSAHLDSSNTHVHARHIDQSGTIDAQQNVIMVGDSIHNFKNIKATTISITQTNPNATGWRARGGHFSNQGSLQAAEQLAIDARNVYLAGGHISAPTSYINSAGYWKNQGEINGEQLIIDAQNDAENGGTIKVSQLITRANGTDDDFFARRRKFLNKGDLQVSEHIFVDAKNIHLNETSQVAAPNIYFKSFGNWRNDGQLKTAECLIDAQKDVCNSGTIDTDRLLRVKAGNILFGQDSDVTSQDIYCKARENVSLGGKIEVERGSVDAGGKVTAIGKIGVSNQLAINATDIVIEKTSEVHAHTASLIAKETIANRGKLSACELFAHAKYVENAGNILVDKARIKADRYFWNKWLSSLEAKEHLTIDAFALFNTLGYIRSDSLHTNAILDVNLLGMYRGCNISRNSIIGLNAGILVPDFKLKLSAKEIALMLGSIALQQYSPRAYAMASLVISLTGVCGRGKELYKQVQELRTKKDLCVSDVVPAICEAKNIFVSAAQIGSQGCGLAQDVWGSSVMPTEAVPRYHQLFHNNGDTSPLKSLIPKIETDSKIINTNNFLPLFSTAVSFLGPQISNNSLLDINAGVMLGVNGNSQSLYNVNAGFSLFANNYSVNTISGTNTGFLGAGNLSVNALASYVNSGKLDVINLSISAHDLEITGKIHASNNALLKAHRNAVIDRKVEAHNITIQAKNTLIKENASIISQNKTQVITEQKLLNKGTIDGNKTIIQGDEVILCDGSKVLAQGNDAATQINAQKLHLKNGSQINGVTNSIDAQSIEGEKGNTIVSQDGTFIKTNELENKGTVQGPLILDFNGNADQLKSIGGVEQLLYKGTIANSLADTLADGHNELLDVAQDGSVAICADKQDIHLKQEHDVAHALAVQTEGAITCDKDLFSEKSLLLQAEGNVQHASVKSQGLTGIIGKNISSEGHVNRGHNGENYEDKCEKSLVSGDQVVIQAQENIHYKGTHVHSDAGGTQIFFGNKLIADDIETEKYNKTQEVASGLGWKTNTTIEDTAKISVPSMFSSEGATYIEGGVAELHGTLFDSKGGTTINAQIEDIPTYDTHKQVKETKNARNGKVTEHTETISRTLKPVTFNGGKSHIISDQPVSLHVAGNAPDISIDAPAVELLVAQKETISVCQQDKTYGGLWNRGPQKETHDIIYDPSYKGTINTTATSIHIEHTKNSIPATINAMHENASITRSLMEDIHQHRKETLYSCPTKLGMGIVALSLSMAMQALGPVVGAGIAKIGMESAILSAMTTQATVGAMNALFQETAHTFLNCNGDFRDAAKKLASMPTVRTIAISALMAGATAGADQALTKVIPPISQATTFSKRCLSTAPRQLINGALRYTGDIAQGKNPKEAAKQRVRSTVANTIGIVGSSYIGQAYRENKIDPITHKALHTGLGAVEGAIVDGKNGAIAGAIGAGLAETIADIGSPQPPSLDDIKKVETQLGRRLTHDEFAREWNKQTVQYLKQAHSIADASKMIAASVALLANQDLNIASDTAANALDNNFFALIDYGIFAKDVAYALYQVPQVYEEKGIEEALKCLGIDVVCAGGKLVLGRVFNEVTFKVGSKIYPSANAAINAVLDQTPGLKQALGNFAKTLTDAGEKWASQGFGKQVANAFQQVNRADTKIRTIEKKALDKIGQRINPSFGEDLVEHVVPNAVVNQIEKQLANDVSKESAQQLALPAPEKILLLPKPVASEVAKETASVLNQDVSLGMKEIAQQGFGGKNNDQDILNKQVEELFKTVSHEKVGKVLPDDIHILKRAKIELETDTFYNKIRTINHDVSAIAKNTNISENIIQRIKNHVFLDDHLFLKYGHRIGKFDVDENIAAAWQRLIDNKFVKSDLILLQHELAESLEMNGMETPYEKAHDLINILYNWNDSL